MYSGTPAKYTNISRYLHKGRRWPDRTNKRRNGKGGNHKGEECQCELELQKEKENPKIASLYLQGQKKKVHERQGIFKATTTKGKL